MGGKTDTGSQCGETTVRCKARHTDRNASKEAQGGGKMDTGDGNTIQYNEIILY